MGYEVDYIPVGTGEKGGDAIAFRYGDLSDPTKQYVVIIDGGTKESGKVLAEHIKKHYGTAYIDLVVASHLHSDHISGLTEILENLQVAKLALHCPWDYTTELKRMTKTEATSSSLQTRIEKSLASLSSLVELAESKKIDIIQPFEGDELLPNLHVLGPSKDYYHQLLANFDVTPEAKAENRIDQFISTVKEAISWVVEELHIETLRDDHPDTSPENNTSLVLLLRADDKKFLFTGDAGKDALTKAINFAETNGVSLDSVHFLDIPHHGSKRNIGPTLLNKLKPKSAFISCPPQGDPKHPSRKVVNALIRRGCDPCTTKKGAPICLYCEFSNQREGWGTAEPEKFFSQVED